MLVFYRDFLTTFINLRGDFFHTRIKFHFKLSPPFPRFIPPFLPSLLPSPNTTAHVRGRLITYIIHT